MPLNFKINFVAVWRFIRRYILRKKPAPKRSFGLIKDKIDLRDHLYRAKFKDYELPESTEQKNLKKFPFRWDQLNLGSCVGQSVRGGFVMTLLTNSQLVFEPSALYAYYNARTDDCKQEDSGASIRDGIKGINRFGLCKEQTWPYKVSKFHIKPPQEAYDEGELHQALIYERIYPVTKEKIMDAVFRGYPVVYGKILYDSFMTSDVASTGIVPYPKKCSEDEVGGHAMFIIDYEKDYTIEMNSWGRLWGTNGSCKVPWKYVLDGNKCFDFWVIYQTEGDSNTNTKQKKRKVK